MANTFGVWGRRPVRGHQQAPAGAGRGRRDAMRRPTTVVSIRTGGSSGVRRRAGVQARRARPDRGADIRGTRLRSSREFVGLLRGSIARPRESVLRCLQHGRADYFDAQAFASLLGARSREQDLLAQEVRWSKRLGRVASTRRSPTKRPWSPHDSEPGPARDDARGPLRGPLRGPVRKGFRCPMDQAHAPLPSGEGRVMNAPSGVLRIEDASCAACEANRAG